MFVMAYCIIRAICHLQSINYSYKINMGLQGNAIFSQWSRHQLGVSSPAREVLFRPTPTSYREEAVSCVLKGIAYCMSCLRQCVALQSLTPAVGSQRYYKRRCLTCAFTNIKQNESEIIKQIVIKLFLFDWYLSSNRVRIYTNFDFKFPTAGSNGEY